jgi:hypothetical protein
MENSKMKLNEVGKKIVYGWIAALSLIFLFMPYEARFPSGTMNQGYRFFLDAPTYSTIQIGTVVIEILIVTLIATALVFLLGREDD